MHDLTQGTITKPLEKFSSLVTSQGQGLGLLLSPVP